MRILDDKQANALKSARFIMLPKSETDPTEGRLTKNQVWAWQQATNSDKDACPSTIAEYKADTEPYFEIRKSEHHTVVMLILYTLAGLIHPKGTYRISAKSGKGGANAKGLFKSLNVDFLLVTDREDGLKAIQRLASAFGIATAEFDLSTNTETAVEEAVEDDFEIIKA